MNRNLLRGALLETVLLDLINDSTDGVHGYALFIEVKRRFGVRLGSSTLYPELKRLEIRGFVLSGVAVDAGRARRRYQITLKGQRLLQENSAQLKTIIPAFAACRQPNVT